jgi:hypothetical protein
MKILVTTQLWSIPSPTSGLSREFAAMAFMASVISIAPIVQHSCLAKTWPRCDSSPATSAMAALEQPFETATA